MVPEVDSSRIDRKVRRFMSSMSIYAALSAMEATDQAGLTPQQVQSRMTGLSLAVNDGKLCRIARLFPWASETQ